MKKLAVSTIASTMLLLSVSGNISHADSSNNINQQKTITQDSIKHLEQKQQNIITTVEKYVELKNDGTIGFVSNIPQDIYKQYKLEELQKHFDYLNLQVTSNLITINPDLSIQNKVHSAVYGSWTYHWWGYDRKFNNSQAKQYVKELKEVQAAGSFGGSLAAALFPVIGAGVVVTAQYYGLLASRVDANNEGSGVYVGMTWALVFDVEPL